VTGFDDSPLAVAISPALATVRQPVDKVASSLLALLTDSGPPRGNLLSGTS
jgi:DNA-binding LacI/PurR family transcriptional regulator